MNRKICAVILATMLGIACIPSNERKNDGMRTWLEFNKSIQTFPYVAPAERVKAVTEGATKLQLGQTKEQVKMIMGNPDFAVYLRKASRPKKFLSCKWAYNLYKTQAYVSASTKDQYVQVFFNQDQKVEALNPQNIVGVEPRNLEAIPTGKDLMLIRREHP